MLRFDNSLALGLTDLALRLGVMATNIQLGGSIESLESLSQRFDLLQRGGIPHQELFQTVRGLREQADISEEMVVQNILTTEGRVWGALSVRSSLPEEQSHRLHELVEGRGDISMLGILEAHRWIRRAFVDGLLHPGDQAKSDVKTTPLVPFPKLGKDLGRPVYVKLEGRQRTGSLKVRGSTYVLAGARLLGRDPLRTRVVTASLGNHAAGLLAAAHNLGFENVEIILPFTVDTAIAARLRKLGAKVSLVGATLEQAEEIARFVIGDDPDALYISRSDHPMFATGLGTIGVEIDAQMTRTQHFHQYAVIAPAGGGSLVAAIGTYLKTRDIPVCGVQAEAFSNLCQSYQQKEIVQSLPQSSDLTLAKNVAVQNVGPQIFQTVRRVVDEMAALPETAIAEAMSYMDEAGFVTEGAAALPVAALLSGAFANVLPKGLPVVLVHTGENIEQAALDELVRRSHSKDRPTRPAPDPHFDAEGNPSFPEDLPQPKNPTKKDP